jgi:hypothetical protein
MIGRPSSFRKFYLKEENDKEFADVSIVRVRRFAITAAEWGGALRLS